MPLKSDPVELLPFRHLIRVMQQKDNDKYKYNEENDRQWQCANVIVNKKENLYVQ